MPQGIALHLTGQRYLDTTVGRARGQRPDGAQALLERIADDRPGSLSRGRDPPHRGTGGRKDQAGPLNRALAQGKDRIGTGARRQLQPDVEALAHADGECRPVDRLDVLPVDRHQCAPHRARVDSEGGCRGAVDDA